VTGFVPLDKVSTLQASAVERPVPGDGRLKAKPRAAATRRRVPRGYETVDSILLTEPRIEAIRREMQRILQLGRFEVDGEPVEISGFQLRDIGDWSDYSTSLSDIFWHLSSVCNFSCEFCYEKGNPEEFPIQSQPRMSTRSEIDTRLRYYRPESGTGIFSVRTAINEPFANPGAIDYLREMRARAPRELVSFVTNGSYLTEDIVKTLAELAPLFFNLSLYSTDPVIRKNVLRDRKGGAAVEACVQLAKHEVPYMANLVMWPSIPFEDMERSIAFAAEQRAAVLRVCLGGYSRYLPGDFDHFRSEEYWPAVVAEVERLRPFYDIPLLIEPSSFVTQTADAVIGGVIVDSPAHLAGIRRGDVITAVDRRPVQTRIQLLSALRRGSQSRFRPPGVAGMVRDIDAATEQNTVLSVLRAGHQRDVALNRYEPASMATYPYGRIANFDDFMYGLVITDGLRYSSLKSAREMIDRSEARRTLLLSSEMMAPVVSGMTEQSGVFSNVDVDLRVPPNDYFGGTINIGDLLTVSDFVAEIERYRAERGDPDLVLIPASPFSTSPWGRDLTGMPWSEIKRLTGLPVELIPCSPLVF
jgi:pyruvate-formate lyase-activating enzyme